MSTREQIREAVNFGSVPEAAISRLVDVCVTICNSFRLSAEELATKWDVYCMSRKIEEATTQHLEGLRRDLSVSLPKQQRSFESPTAKSSYDGNLLSDDRTLTPTLKRKAVGSPAFNSRTPPSARLEHNEASLIQASPTSYKYRDASGKVEASLVGLPVAALPLPESGHADKKRVEILLFPNQQTQAYRYQFEKLTDKAAALDERIDILTDAFTKQYGIEQIEHPARPTQSEVTTAGRISCDSSEGKLNTQSLILEASRNLAAGARVKLLVSDVPSYSIFPGQVVGAVGLNNTGQAFAASKLLTGVPWPLEFTKGSELREYNYGADKLSSKPCVIYIASGPYALEDSLEYEPFNDLIEIVKKDAPNVLMLLGPFVDADHPKIQQGDINCTLEDLFKEKVAARINDLRQSGNHTQVILIPSLLDAHHHPVFPQPPFSYADCNISKDVLCYPNPVTFSINEVIIGVSTNDILMHLTREEISKRRGDEPNDRMARLAEHVLQQRSYYPLFPPASGAQIDYGHMTAFNLPTTPDILILSSDLKCFAKNVNGTVCVNPGRLTKKKSGGTFAKVVVHPLPLVDIIEDDKMVAHQVADRSHIEILRL